MDEMFFVSRLCYHRDEISKIEICHIVTKEHPEVIDGRQRLISVDVIDSGESYEDSSIDNGDSDLYEEYGGGLVGAGVTEDVEDMHKALKSSSILFYMSKPSRLITQGFG